MNRTALGFLAAALLAGGAIGYVAGTSAGGGEIAVIGEEEAGPTFRPSPPPQDPGGEATAAFRYRNLRDALESIPVPRSERGSGSFTGRVTTEGGDPLGGVTVRAWARQKEDPRHRYRRGQGAPEDKDLEVYVRDAVKSYLGGIDSRRETLTDADGYYTVTGLLEGEDDVYYANAYAEGYELRMNPHVPKIRAGSVVNFVAKPVLSLPCHVYMPDETIPEKATITASQGNRSRSHTWYSDTPELQLDPGDYQLQATGGEHNYLRSDKVSVTVEAGGPPPPVHLHLKDEPGVRGTVEFPPGEGNLNGQVGLLKIEDGQAAEPEKLLREGQKQWVYSSRNYFVFRDITPGTYLLGMIFNHQVIVEHKTVEVGDSMVSETLTLPAPDASQYVLLTVLAPTGSKVAGLHFNAGYRAGSSNWSSSTRYQQMPDGTWRVFHHPVKKEHLKPEGTHYLRITSQKYGTKEVEYAAASTSALTVQFDDPASLTVTVAGYRGSGLENKIRIDVKPTPRENEPRRYTSYYGRNRGGLDAEGVQKFGPLAPGEYDITLSIQQDRSRYLPAETVTTVLKAGDNSETLSLPKLYNLTVIVDAGQEGASFRLNSRDSSRGWYGSSHKKATDGRVVFENLVPGDYTLQAWGSVSGQMYVTIPAQTTVRFEPVVFNAQKVRVRDESGTFVKAGLREGDLVVGIDGEEFLNERQMGALFTLAREKKNVTLTVVRGGRRLQVAVDFTDAYNQKVSGIYWERSSR